jgi:hypothetical protein
LTKHESRRTNAGEEGTPMLRVVVDDDASAELRAGLDEIVHEGARRMLVATLEQAAPLGTGDQLIYLSADALGW